MRDKKKEKEYKKNQYNYLLSFFGITPLFIDSTAVSTNVSNDNNDPVVASAAAGVDAAAAVAVVAACR